MQKFYPSYVNAVVCLTLAAILLFLELLMIGYSLTPATPDNPQGGSMGPALAVGIIVVPGGLLILDIAIGIFRSRAILTDQGLDLTTTRFAIWKIRRVYRVKLAWDEIFGVQIWEQSNASAPDGIQRDCIVHSAQGKYVVSSMVWPQFMEFAEAVSKRIGRPIGDIQEASTLVSANRPQDRTGLAILHGCGLVSMICGIIFSLLLLVAAFGGISLKDFGIVAVLCSVMIMGGAALRRYQMQ